MVKISMSVCDICRDPAKKAEAFRVTGRGITATVDLCADDAKPLDDVLKAHGRRPSRRRTFETAVTTMEELEAKKSRRTE